ncbi:amino acid transporter, partial [Salmonella enterica subsp. enterica serovar Heidelberg]
MTAMLLRAFCAYTVITALAPGPSNILAVSAASERGFRWSIRVLAGMSLGFWVVML